MNKQRFLALLIGLVCFFLGTNGMRAMASPHFRLDWFAPLTGSGAPASSAHFAVNLTVGQTAINVSASPNYQSCLGYWCGSEAAELDVYLPLVIKN